MQKCTTDGVRTHADFRLADLKSAPLDHSGTVVKWQHFNHYVPI